MYPAYPRPAAPKIPAAATPTLAPVERFLNLSVSFNFLSSLAGAGLLGKGAAALLGLSGPVGWTVTAVLSLVVLVSWLYNVEDKMWKKVADDFCGHVKDDGIYHYCVKKGWL